MTDLSCAEARSLVSDYIDGELPTPTAQALERHLQSCRSCPPLYASLIASLAALKAADIGGPEVDNLVRRVVTAVNAIGA